MHYEVFYKKDPTFWPDPDLTIADVENPEKFASVKHLCDSPQHERFGRYAKNIDDVFYRMQAENWSPNGEARDLIRSKGLHHTSMSVGDVVCVFGWGRPFYFQVDNVGWKPVFESRRPKLKNI